VDTHFDYVQMLLLIEKRASESRSQILAFLAQLAHETSDGSKESLDFDLWESRRFQGREFVRLVCRTGTAQQFVAQALTGNGIARDLLQGERINGQPVAWLISSGQKLSCNPFDIETICERCRGNAATNALSDLGPPGGTTGQRMWHLCRSCENEFSAERDRFMHKFAPASGAEMSAEQRHAAAANWRQEVNSHMTHWVLGDQPQ
jgi:hypothetical protein